MRKEHEEDFPLAIEISDDDIYEAMKAIPGYIDITPEDFKEVYKLAYRQALERIVLSIRAADIMTREVLSVKRDTPLQEVAETMARGGIAGVPVVEEDGSVVGVISEKDLLRRMGAGEANNFMAVVAECLKGEGCVAVSIRAKVAKDIMTSPAITVKEDTTVIEIADTFTKKGINRVPVVDSEGHLIGIVSRADIVRAPFIKQNTEHRAQSTE